MNRPALQPCPKPGPHRYRLGVSSVALALAASIVAIVLAGEPAQAQGARAPGSAAPIASTSGTPRRGAVEEGVRWQKLKPAQREALEPLQREWSSIDAMRKQKWVQLADRMRGLPADERARVEARMSDWARLTPAERGQARLRFQEAKQIPPSDRRSRWAAYQALSPEQKSELAAKAAAVRSRNAAERAARHAPAGVARDRGAREGAQAKSNIVPNPAYAAPPRQIGPTVVQASPGATTTLITRRPMPPPHQQTGLPKIAATPEFVDRSTLLPQRGAQSAAIRSVPPARPASSARR